MNKYKNIKIHINNALVKHFYSISTENIKDIKLIREHIWI